MESKKQKILFSAVLYTANEEYKKTLDSIISQTVGADNIQIIILKSKDVKSNDFSKYNNITVSDKNYVSEQEAYNDAMKYVKGKYVCFPESGSVYSDNAFLAAQEFFNEKFGQIKIAALNCDKNSTSPNVTEINKKIGSKDNIIDLNEKYTIPFIFLSNCFISTELDINMSYRLESHELYICKVMMNLISQTETLGVIDSKQAFITPYESQRLFLKLYEDFRYSENQLKEFAEDFLCGTVNEFKNSVGFVPKYVQYNMLIFIEWCVNAPGAEDIIQKVFSLEEFEKILSDILNETDDSVISANTRLQLAHKYFLLEIKYNRNSHTVIQPHTKKLYFENTKLCDISNNLTTVEFVTLTGKKLIIQGRAKYIDCDKDKFSVYALVNGEETVECKNIGHSFDTLIWGENVYGGITFTFELELKEDNYNIEFFSKHNGDIIKRKNIRFGKFSPLASNVSDCYYYSDGRIMRFDNNRNIISVEKASGFSAFKSELKYLKFLLKQDNEYAKHAFAARIMYRFLKLFNRKQIWLISDRSNRGDDNGEAFFKYMQTVKNNKIKCFFVIDKDCEEGQRMKKIGKTISTNSKKHKLYHLLSTYIISSQGNNPVVNPLLGGNIYYRDILCNNKFVFLQHGVTKDDISSWLNLYNRNIYGFIVTTNPEYKSIFDYDYFYTPKEVWLTGMPRNDLLYHNEQKYITIMPTWRKSLMTHPDPVTGIWLIRDDFKNSEYFRFYNSLLNDERLLKVAKEHNYKLCFKPHPNIEPYVYMFDKNENVIFFDTEKTYRDIFAETNLMLTDYSSVAFDFAYLRKPIVYAQFDKEEFFSGAHSYTEGYFDYERDGFGEVEYNLEDTVNRLIEYIESDCKPKDKYLTRINNTFAFSDKNCCERVYKKLIGKE